MPHSYNQDLVEELLEISVVKMIEMDREPDPPMLKHVLIMNLLKGAGVPKSLLFGKNHRDDFDDHSKERKHRKLNDGYAEGVGEPTDALPKIDVTGLINHLAEGFPLAP